MATDPQPISDADLLTFAVIVEYRARQQHQGINILLFPYPPCPTCGAQVHEVGVSGMPIATGQTMRLRPCLHRYQVTEDAMLRIGQHAQDMLENLEWNGITGTPDDLAAETRTRLGETPAEPVSSTLYFCPRSGEVESATRGGFDQCCDRPELHVPLPDGPGTEKLSQLLARVARAPFHRMAEAAIRAVKNALAAEQADFVLAPSSDGGDEGLREQYTTAISRWHRDPEQPLYTQGADAVLAVRDRRMEQLAAGRATWKAKAEEIERDRDRLAIQVDRLTARLGQYADRAIANGERAEAAAATLARLREYAETTDHDGIRTRENVLRILDEAGDRSGCGPRACDPSAAGHSPGNPSGEGAQ